MILARTRSPIQSTAEPPRRGRARATGLPLSARFVAAGLGLVTGAALLLEWVQRNAQYRAALSAQKTSLHIRPLDDLVGALGAVLLIWSIATLVILLVRLRHRRTSPRHGSRATPPPQDRPEAPETR